MREYYWFLYLSQSQIPARVETTEQRAPVPGSDGEEETLRQPTASEITESKKPENVNAIKTNRGKKRTKHKLKVEQTKNESKAKDLESIKSYLSQWKHDKQSWKFEKRKQWHIQNNVFKEDQIGNDVWDICLEYLESSKGKGRDSLIAEAEKLIATLDDGASAKARDAEGETKYKRARDILQMLSWINIVFYLKSYYYNYTYICN